MNFTMNNGRNVNFVTCRSTRLDLVKRKMLLKLNIEKLVLNVPRLLVRGLVAKLYRYRLKNYRENPLCPLKLLVLRHVMVRRSTALSWM